MKKNHSPFSSFARTSGLLLLTMTTAYPDLVLYEGFEYDEGLAFDALAGGTGWDGEWSTAEIAPGAARHSVGPGLSFGDLTIVGGAGERSIRNGRSTAMRIISATSTTSLTADNSTIWFSVLMDPTINIEGTGGQPANTYATIVFGNEALADASTGALAGAGTLIANSGNGLGVGFVGNTTPTAFGDVGIQGLTFTAGVIDQSNGETNGIVTGDTSSFIVGRIDWAADGSSDTVALYNVLDTSAALPAPFSTMTLDVDQSDFDTISIADGQTAGFDEIRFGNSLADVVPGTSVTIGSDAPLTLSITPSGTTLDFAWESVAGMAYDIVSSTDLSSSPSTWAVYDDGSGPLANIPASGTGTNDLTGVARLGEKRFFAVVEKESISLTVLSAGFEDDDGGFTVTNKGTGSNWQSGFPNAIGPRGTITGGSGEGSTNAWGTLLGEDENTGGVDQGQYLAGTSTCLSSPVIDLSDFSTSATLNFDENLDFPAEDIAEVYLIDDTTDAIIGAGPIYTASDADPAATVWTPVPEITLPAEALGKEVRIEFRFTGNGGASADYLGWYIDNVVVEAF